VVGLFGVRWVVWRGVWWWGGVSCGFVEREETCFLGLVWVGWRWCLFVDGGWRVLWCLVGGCGGCVWVVWFCLGGGGFVVMFSWWGFGLGGGVCCVKVGVCVCVGGDLQRGGVGFVGFGFGCLGLWFWFGLCGVGGVVVAGGFCCFWGRGGGFGVGLGCGGGVGVVLGGRGCEEKKEEGGLLVCEGGWGGV